MIILAKYPAPKPLSIFTTLTPLAQLFSSFYNASPIMGAETSEIAASRLALARLTRDVLVKLLYLLGIEAPEAMLKA